MLPCAHTWKILCASADVARAATARREANVLMVPWMRIDGFGSVGFVTDPNALAKPFILESHPYRMLDRADKTYPCAQSSLDDRAADGESGTNRAQAPQH